MIPNGPSPQPATPGWITPSLLSTMRTCPRRAGYQLDPRFGSLRRSGLRAALGRLAHRVLEESGAEDFEAAWSAAEAETWAELRREWAPATPPTPRNWPGWALTRARIRARWQKGESGPTTAHAEDHPRAVGNHERPHRSTAHSGPHGPLPWVERTLADPGRRMRGRPDLVQQANGRVRLVDHKTGVTQGEANEDQILQLAFYVSLVEHVMGRPPDEVAVRDASGLDHLVVIDQETVHGVQADATSARSALEEAFRGGDLLAHPASGACATCPFRLLCTAFLDEYSPDWACGHVRIVRLPSILAQQDGAMDVEVLAPSWAHKSLHMVGFALPGAQPGQLWGISDYEGPDTTAIARWNSLAHAW